MKGIEGTATFQFWPVTFRESQSEGITMADTPSYTPFMPSSSSDCTMEQMKAGK